MLAQVRITSIIQYQRTVGVQFYRHTMEVSWILFYPPDISARECSHRAAGKSSIKIGIALLLPGIDYWQSSLNMYTSKIMRRGRENPLNANALVYTIQTPELG